MWFYERAPSSAKCVLKSCEEKRTGRESLSFFAFPKNPVRCEIWLKNCQLDADSLPRKNIKLCSKHFEKKMFLNDLRNRLQPHAIPTLFADVPSIIDNASSPGATTSFCSDDTNDTPLASSSASSSKCCQIKILKVWSEKTPSKVL